MTQTRDGQPCAPAATPAGRKTLRRLLSTTHSLVTTVLPLRDGRVPRIRKPPIPDPEQALVCQNLGNPWRSAFPRAQSCTYP